MMKSFLLLIAAVVLLTGCEDIFGKESGERGALPGKRLDVFAEDAGLKPDAEGENAAVELPTENNIIEWTAPGGSVTRAFGHASLAAAPRQAWSVSIGAGSDADGVVTATPVIAGGKVYTVDSRGIVSAFSAANGDRLWSKAVPDPAPENAMLSGSGLAYADGKLIVATSYGYVTALDTATQKVLWQRNLLAAIRSAPVIQDGKVYITSMDNTLHELALADGGLGWSHSGVQETALFLGMASPAISEELVIVPYNSGEIFGVRRINGRMVWEENLAGTKRSGTLPAMADIQAQPVLDGNKVYATSHSGRFVALDARTGSRIWEADAGSVETPWLAGKNLFVVTTESQLAGLNAETGRVRWAVNLLRYSNPDNKTQTVSWAGPVLAGGNLWLANSLGEMKAYDPQNGREKQSFDLGSPVYLAPVIADRTLYVLTDGGTLVAFR
jgi:outer membrane protein assembly factor BamB